MDKPKILTHCDCQPVSLGRFVPMVRHRQRRTGRISGETASVPVVQARINHGRWIADCPFCAGAEMVDADDLRFFCASCDMQTNGRRWLRVVMPEPNKRREIEELLCCRPEEHQQNWFCHETTADLRLENAKFLHPMPSAHPLATAESRPSGG